VAAVKIVQNVSHEVGLSVREYNQQQTVITLESLKAIRKGADPKIVKEILGK
jgi:hypothetical protein